MQSIMERSGVKRGCRLQSEAEWGAAEWGETEKGKTQ